MKESLRVNTTISHYRILSRIGAGGMGEVWRARDTKLGRDVAIKVLPAAFSANAERLRRFEQEAQAAGALSGHRAFRGCESTRKEGSTHTRR